MKPSEVTPTMKTTTNFALMGATFSIPKENIVMGKINTAAPNIYRNSQIQDHISPYESRRCFRTKFAGIVLALALDAFNSRITCKLNIETVPLCLTDAELEISKKEMNRAKNLQNALLFGPNAIDFTMETNRNETTIYLCKNYLVELNEYIWIHKTTTSVQICCNYLTYLPYGISQLKGLKILVISRNRISQLPDEIGLCRELRDIDVSSNLIRKLPKSMMCLKKLNSLQIGTNLLTEIPSFLGKIQSLKYLNLSYNKISSIPFEIFKLPFLLSLNCTGCRLHLNNHKIFKINGKMSLLETVARQIIRKNIPVKKTTETSLVEYILRVQECSFCGGPFFDYYISVEDFHIFEAEIYPIHYKMCSMHYKKHQERLTTLFERTMPTFPTKIFEENLRSVTELFEPHGYDQVILQNTMDRVELTGIIPLVCLTLYNAKKYRRNTIESFFEADQYDTNTFDDIFDQS